MFESASDVDLIDVMGEATRDESTAIAQRLAAVGVLYSRRERERAECKWWSVDATDAVAAEVSAVQNISHARAVGQVHYARTLRERLPRVAKVFATGVIDFRMVSTIIARTENVDDDVMARLDEALARHAEKWMKLSKPKLRDRVDLWVAKFDPAGVRVPPKVDENRYVDIDPGSVGMAFISGQYSCRRRGGTGQAAGCAGGHGVRERSAHHRAASRGCHAGRWPAVKPRWPASAGSADCPATAERAAASAAVIHVVAEQATIDGTSDHPGYLPGFGILPAESVRDLADCATLKPVPAPTGQPDAGLSALEKDRAVRAVAGSDVPLAGLRRTG